MRIRLIGDHSGYHCGSAAAFQVLSDIAKRYGRIVDRKEEFDLLLVNGEGSMHHESKGFKKKMDAIESALSSGKQAMLLNTVWQDNPQRYADILKRCAYVSVRETLSRQVLADQGVTAELAVDASFYASIDDDAPIMDFGNAVVLTDFWSRDFGAFVVLNSKRARAMSYVDMTTLSWSSLVKSLRTASLLVTGRHHAVYAACRARIPFLALTGNTHKIEGLVAGSGVKIPVYTNFAELWSNLEACSYREYAYTQLFDWMDAQPAPQLPLPRVDECRD